MPDAPATGQEDTRRDEFDPYEMVTSMRSCGRDVGMATEMVLPTCSARTRTGERGFDLPDAMTVQVGNELEEQVRGPGFEWYVVHLVHNQQGDAAELDQLVLRPVGVVGVGQPGHPLSGGGERDRVVGAAAAAENQNLRIRIWRWVQRTPWAIGAG